MKKKTFVILMVVELIYALISMGWLYSDVGALIYPISLLIFAVVLAPFFLWLKKVDEEKKKRKIRLLIVLIMLIPILEAIIALATLVIGLAMYYGF